MTTEPEKSEGAAETAPAETKRRLTPEEWREIEVHWEYGTLSTKEICEKFGITPSAVTQHFAALKARGIIIVKNSKKAELAKKTAAAVTGAAAGSAAGKAISAFNEKRAERAEQTKEAIYRQSAFNAVIFGRLQKEIADGTRTMASCKAEFQALRLAEAYLKLSRENRYAVLEIEHMVDEDDLPVLAFEELTPDEIKQIQQGDDEDVDLSDLIDGKDSEDGVVEEGDT